MRLPRTVEMRLHEMRRPQQQGSVRASTRERNVNMRQQRLTGKRYDVHRFETGSVTTHLFLLTTHMPGTYVPAFLSATGVPLTSPPSPGRLY